MNKTYARLLLFAGACLSLVALIIGGSLLQPVQKTVSERSTALLYKFAANVPASTQSGISPIGRVLIADLESMQVSLYDGGVVKNIFPILSKGRPGTPWETPTGAYTIQAKEVKHYSSIGGTWMPYSMQFYGNFFIHGWPTYVNGKDVPVGYSGGCIRLATEDARMVYEFIPRGAKIMVLSGVKDDEFATSSRYYLHGEGHLPKISASSFVVADANTGATLWERRARDLKGPKGLALLASGLTAVETVNQYKLVRMSELLMGSAILRKYSIGAIDEMPAGTLMYPLLFDGSDTAARVFAKEHGTKQFVTYMNEKSRAIGMNDTIFGGALSSDESTTTARDLMTLLRYVNERKHFLLDVTLAREQTLTDVDGDERYNWTNKNPWVLSGDGAFRGGLVANDPSGHSGAMLLFDLPLAEFGPRTIAFVIMDSDDVAGDISALRRFIGEHFVYGVEREGGAFIRETEDPTPNLLQRVKELMNLEMLLQDEVVYKREV